MIKRATSIAAAVAEPPSPTAVSSSDVKRPQLIRDEDGTFHAIVWAPSAKDCLDIKALTYNDLCLRLEGLSLPRPLPHNQEPEVWE